MQEWPGLEPPHLQRPVAFLPCYRLCLKAPKPLPFVLDPKTLGQHLRKRRWVLKQLQREAAAEIGVNKWTYMGWETNGVMPCVSLVPRVVKYLGYNPCEPTVPPSSFGGWLGATRRRFGLSREAIGDHLGVDKSTVGDWEEDVRMPSAENRERLEAILGKCPVAVV